jgi:hypothetical protein
VWRHPHFVGLVVVLRVVLEDLLLLGVVEMSDEIVKVEFFAPFLAFNKPVCLSVCKAGEGASQRTLSLQRPHRTCGRVEIAAKILSQASDGGGQGGACIPVSEYRVSRCSRPARASIAAGKPGHLALGSCVQGGHFDSVGQWLGSHSDRTWDPGSYGGFLQPL